MRRAFVSALTAAADREPRVVLLTGDLGFSVLEPFAERHPDRFVNAGVAEQNMLGVATGLAEAGFLPFVYSITPFAVLRPYEFIRDGPLAHRLPVRIVGAGEGTDYGTNGISHYALEDLALMRVLPGMTTVAPCDGEQMATALQALLAVPGPVYFRLCKDPLPPLAELQGRFAPGRVEPLLRGRDVLLLATGQAAHTSLAAARLLEGRGISAAVGALAGLSPVVHEELAGMLAEYRAVVTVENHLRWGGLGSLVCEAVASTGLATRVLTLGIDGWPSGAVGPHPYMQRRFGLDPEAVAERTARWLDERRSAR